MPVLSPSKKKSMLAAGKRSELRKSTGPRSIDIILPAINPIDALPSKRKRDSVEPLRYVEQFKERKRPKRFPSTKFQSDTGRRVLRSASTIMNNLDDIMDLEKKWSAVLDYSCSCHPDGSIPRNVGNAIAKEFGVTLQTLSNWYWKAKKQGTLIRKQGSGRKPILFDTANRSLKEIYMEFGGALSQWTLSVLLREKNLTVSKHTVQRILAGFVIFISYLMANSMSRTRLVYSEEQTFTSTHPEAP